MLRGTKHLDSVSEQRDKRSFTIVQDDREDKRKNVQSQYTLFVMLRETKHLDSVSEQREKRSFTIGQDDKEEKERMYNLNIHSLSC